MGQIPDRVRKDDTGVLQMSQQIKRLTTDFDDQLLKPLAQCLCSVTPYIAYFISISVFLN